MPIWEQTCRAKNLCHFWDRNRACFLGKKSKHGNIYKLMQRCVLIFFPWSPVTVRDERTREHLFANNRVLVLVREREHRKIRKARTRTEREKKNIKVGNKNRTRTWKNCVFFHPWVCIWIWLIYALRNVLVMMTSLQDHDIFNEVIIRHFDVNVTVAHIISHVPVRISNTTH